MESITKSSPYQRVTLSIGKIVIYQDRLQSQCPPIGKHSALEISNLEKYLILPLIHKEHSSDFDKHHPANKGEIIVR